MILRCSHVLLYVYLFKMRKVKMRRKRLFLPLMIFYYLLLFLIWLNISVTDKKECKRTTAENAFLLIFDRNLYPFAASNGEFRTNRNSWKIQIGFMNIYGVNYSFMSHMWNYVWKVGATVHCRTGNKTVLEVLEMWTLSWPVLTGCWLTSLRLRFFYL